MLHCDLKNVSKSFVSVFKVGLVGIHNMCELDDFTSKLKEVRDVIGFVTDRFVMNRFVTDSL